MIEQKDKSQGMEIFRYISKLMTVGQASLIGAPEFIYRRFPSLTRDEARAFLMAWLEEMERITDAEPFNQDAV
jgi:hypothetical protein